MGRNSAYFIDKDNRAKIALNHTEQMDRLYSNETNESIKNTKIYSSVDSLIGRETYTSNIQVLNMTTVQAIQNEAEENKFNRICALNFASYKNPGGMFLNGSSAQEESLCHSSNLYNILKEFDDTYYEWNRKHLNRGLYTNRALYTKDVIFVNDDKTLMAKADIITCAAPNASVGLRYKRFTADENKLECVNRIKFILSIAASNKVDTLILGAFGCGVFSQDAKDISNIFKELLEKEFKGVFKKVLFAIPDTGKSWNYNYTEFKRNFN